MSYVFPLVEVISEVPGTIVLLPGCSACGKERLSSRADQTNSVFRDELKITHHFGGF